MNITKIQAHPQLPSVVTGLIRLTLTTLTILSLTIQNHNFGCCFFEF